LTQKKLEDGDFVMPGDVLGVEEEFIPGENAFVEGGVVHSSATGKVQFDTNSRKVSVFPTSHLPPFPVRGDTVVGKMSFIRGQFARMDIVAIEGETKREIPSGPEGAVHISQTRRNYVRDLVDQFQVGDIVRAKVVNSERDPIILGTVDDEYGVILAKCRECRETMVLKDQRLYCESCDAFENRKISTLYGTNPL
jgi:exosome complex component CSL4